jgi:hypothetical protein
MACVGETLKKGEKKLPSVSSLRGRSGDIPQKPYRKQSKER